MAEWELSNTEAKAPSIGYVAGLVLSPANLFFLGNLSLP